MYCTGGVRCERASALLMSKYKDTVAGVYQLQVSGVCVSRCSFVAFSGVHTITDWYVWLVS
jgi:hypothetical protein